MSRPLDADRLTRVRALRPGTEVPPGPGCLDDDTLAALAEGSLDGDARSIGLAHLAGCMRCRRDVASIARALADPDLARELLVVESDGWSRVLRRRRVVVGVAAAAAAVLLFAMPRSEGPSNAHRSPAITASAAPDAVSPVGRVSEARSLRWTPVPGADRYRVTLFGRDGSIRFETEVAGTVVVLPDSVVVGPGESGWWQVDARLGFDRWAASELIEFSVAAGFRR